MINLRDHSIAVARHIVIREGMDVGKIVYSGTTALAVIAALGHDIAKGPAGGLNPWHCTSQGHARRSAEILQSLLSGLNETELDRVVAIVEHHHDSEGDDRLIKVLQAADRDARHDESSELARKGIILGTKLSGPKENSTSVEKEEKRKEWEKPARPAPNPDAVRIPWPFDASVFLARLEKYVNTRSGWNATYGVPEAISTTNDLVFFSPSIIWRELRAWAREIGYNPVLQRWEDDGLNRDAVAFVVRELRVAGLTSKRLGAGSVAPFRITFRSGKKRDVYFVPILGRFYTDDILTLEKRKENCRIFETVKTIELDLSKKGGKRP